MKILFLLLFFGLFPGKNKKAIIGSFKNYIEKYRILHKTSYFAFPFFVISFFMPEKQGLFLIQPHQNFLSLLFTIFQTQPFQEEFKIQIIEGHTFENIEIDLSNFFKQNVQLDRFETFPDTYFISYKKQFKTLQKKMKDNFEKKIKILQTEFPHIINEYKINGKIFKLQDLIILASIVEKEAATENDMLLISQCFLHRLHQIINLGSCATICYALKIKPVKLKYKHIAINHPYNTYKNFGLPPGPICVPSFKALKSVLQAIYLFQTKKQLPFKYFYYNKFKKLFLAKSLNEHLHNQKS